jgi:hypothetical protein
MIKGQVKSKKQFGKDLLIRGLVTITGTNGKQEWFYISPKGFIRPANMKPFQNQIKKFMARRLDRKRIKVLKY